MTVGRHSRRGWRAALLAALGATVVAGCSAPVDVTTTGSRPLPTTSVVTRPATTVPPSTEPSTTTPPTTAPGSPVVLRSDGNRQPQAYDEALSAAILDIQAYWEQTFPKLYGAAYTDLQGGIWPVYPGARGVPGCGEPQTRFREIQGNAFYCPQGDFMAFDDQGLFPDIYNRYGSDVLALVVAHEWGHAIQTRAGINEPTIVLEQQADCFAGAWLAHVSVEPKPPMTVNDGTLNLAVAGMVTFSDAAGTSSSQQGAHGSGFDRVGAFQDGYGSGPSRCVNYPSAPPPVIELPFTAADVQNRGNMEYDRIVSASVDDLDRFWSGVFAARRVPYSKPAGGLQPYRAAGPYPSCPSLSPDASFYQDRVWYCPDGDFIAYDQDALAGRIYDIGDYAVAVLIGNAWADAMQQRLGVALTGKDRSLEADCLTGAWTHSTLPDQRQSSDTLQLSGGDLDEGIVAFLRFGSGDSASQSAQVGTVFDRVASFRLGVLQGVSACGIG